jgi:hypothetical protein
MTYEARMNWQMVEHNQMQHPHKRLAHPRHKASSAPAHTQKSEVVAHRLPVLAGCMERLHRCYATNW